MIGHPKSAFPNSPSAELSWISDRKSLRSTYRRLWGLGLPDTSGDVLSMQQIGLGGVFLVPNLPPNGPGHVADAYGSFLRRVAIEPRGTPSGLATRRQVRGSVDRPWTRSVVNLHSHLSIRRDYRVVCSIDIAGTRAQRIGIPEQ